MCPMSNNYKNLSRAMEKYSILKKDVNADAYCKYISYRGSNSKGKYNCYNIKGIGKVHFNKLVLLV
jgi:hypothetical protein